MIIVTLNEDNFAYDIHSLVKAFYPEQEVKVFVKGQKDLESDFGLPAFFVRFETAKICCGLYKTCAPTGGENEDFVRESVLSAPDDRVAVKNELKRLLYDMLSGVTGKKLPWGTLTGIRPTKIAVQLLEQGKSEAEVRSYMTGTYLASAEKTALSIDIAKREMEILSPIHYEKGYSLYIGIPFCPTTCLYCSFTSFPICVWKKRVGEYLDAVEKEIDFVKEACKDKILDSVYIGGGTPTTLEPDQLERLLSKLKESFDWTNVQEFTVEAGRADSITREKLRVLQKHGVTRISVNPQTMNQKTLKLIGRQHTVEQVEEAFAMAREEGFDNINMDLILGLPGETKEDVAYTIQRVKALNPDSLTVHSLAIKRASKLSQWIIENGISTLNNTDETMEIAADGAYALGMEPYYLYRQKNMSGNFENVGYAKPGKAGIYNILIMEEKESIMALGAGTISKAVFGSGRIERCDNVKDVALYIEKIDEMIDRKRKLLGLEK
ncbi:MAG: coproporphyrinogen dehydrogenase HemZ [Lachnospiraceae bacterium]|nr:coproporphyrinogen dehydrogenase HemZ [Lachnospiraceae bacterium]